MKLKKTTVLTGNHASKIRDRAKSENEESKTLIFNHDHAKLENDQEERNVLISKEYIEEENEEEYEYKKKEKIEKLYVPKGQDGQRKYSHAV